MKQKNLIPLYILLTSSMFFWGTSFVFTVAVLPVLDPISLIFIRLVISSVLLWATTLLFFRKQKPPKSLLKWVLLMTFFEPFIYFLGETYGLQRVSPVVVSLFIATIPVFTAIVMSVFFHAKLSAVNFLGIFISICGIFCIIVNKDLSFDADLIGLVLVFIAVFTAVGHAVLLGKISKKAHPVWLITIQNTFGIFLFLPLFLLFGKNPEYENGEALFSFLSVKETMWLYIILLAVFCSSLAFIFYILAVRKIGVVKANVFSNLVPIFTAIVSYFLLDELFTTQKIVGIAIVILGVALTQKSYKQPVEKVAN